MKARDITTTTTTKLRVRTQWLATSGLVLSVLAVGCAGRADRTIARPDDDSALADQVRDADLSEHDAAIADVRERVGPDDVADGLALADVLKEKPVQVQGEVEPEPEPEPEPEVEPTNPGRSNRIELPDSRDPLAGLF